MWCFPCIRGRFVSQRGKKWKMRGCKIMWEQSACVLPERARMIHQPRPWIFWRSTSRGHGRAKGPQSWATDTFDTPRGGICFGFEMSRGSFVEKVDFYRHQVHFLKEAVSRCDKMRPLASPQRILEGVKKRTWDLFWKRCCCGHGEAPRVENVILMMARDVLGGQKKKESRTTQTSFEAPSFSLC